MGRGTGGLSHRGTHGRGHRRRAAHHRAHLQHGGGHRRRHLRVAVISLAGIVDRPVRVGGDKMDEAILQYIKRTYNLLIGERTAEIIKTTIGNAFPGEPESMDVKGRDLVSGIPKIININSDEVRLAIQEQIDAIIAAVKTALSRPPRSWPRTSWTGAST